MELSSDLISQFVKSTNDRDIKQNEIIIYGVIVSDGDQNYVKFDGSAELAPIQSTVEVSPGDRVIVTVKNHSATVTGNTTDPAIGTKTAEGLRSSITQTAEEIRLEVANEVSGIQSSITQHADSITSIVKGQDEFSKFQQTVEGFSFMGTGGTVKIQLNDLSNDIKTSIDNATPRYQYSINGLTNWVDWTIDMDMSKYKYRRESYDGGQSWSGAYQFAGTDGKNGSNGSDASVTYANIKSALNRASNAAMTVLSGTSIDTVDIYANNIYGGNLYAGEGAETFANVNETGFFLYHENATNPKAMLAVEDGGDIIQLILGSGISNTSQKRGRLFLKKTITEGGIYFYDEDLNECGFTFGADGNITVHGNMTSTATFG